jgi:molecular chaperone DnaK
MHSEEDKRRREEIEAANQADSIAYQVERQLRELGDRVPVNEKARAEQLISETRSLAKNNPSDTARLRQLTSDLQQMASGLAAAASGPAPSAASQGAAGPQNKQPGSEEVIDAEFRQAG